jgi:hypothetical protein
MGRLPAQRLIARVWSRTRPAQLIETGLRDQDVHLWNEKVLSNYFCKTCGIFTYIGDGENAKDDYRVNLGCVEGLDPLALEISLLDHSVFFKYLHRLVDRQSFDLWSSARLRHRPHR